jgi:antitoxin component YwqK of YwqJK toxin-antitoxin module
MPGFITTYIKDGVKCTLHDGILHSEEPVGGTGISRRFHPNGTIHAEVPLEKGMTHGTARTWHENGKLASEAQHVYGTIRGVTRSWNADGSQEAELNYVLTEAVYGRTYGDAGRVHSAYLWNGKPMSKALWTKKVLAIGLTPEELDERLARFDRVPPSGSA